MFKGARQHGEVLFLRKDLHSGWASQKELFSCSPTERRRYNLRKLMPDEIVLDCDSNNFDVVSAQLKKDGYSFASYNSSGLKQNAGHIHMHFPELRKYPAEIRNALRRTFIQKYGADVTKASENTWIAECGRPHFKTGKIKALIELHLAPGNNVLPADCAPGNLPTASESTKNETKYDYTTTTTQTSSRLVQDTSTSDRAKTDLVARIKAIPLPDVLSALTGQQYHFGLNLCPLHNDKEPSLSLDKRRNLWKCFGRCNTGGSAIDFVMRLRGCSAKEAIHEIAERFGLNG